MSKIPKTAGKSKRGSRGMGRLYKKANGKIYPADSKAKGNYYLQYTLNGKRIATVLKDADGNNITDRDQAEAERKRILAPYQTGQTVETLRAVQTRIIEAEAEHIQAVEDANPPPQIKQIWDLFLASPARPDSGENTLRVYSFKWQRFLDWLTKNYPEKKSLHEITTADASQYVQDLTTAKLSASTFNQHRNLLRMVWRVLADECRLSSNPWDKVSPRKLNQLSTRKRALTQGQFDDLMEAAKGKADQPDLHDLFTVLAWTGLRLVDAVLMKWGAVDFRKKVISLAPVKTARRMGKMVHIPIFPAVLDVLNRRQEGQVLNPKGFVFPELAARYDADASAVSKSISKAFSDAGMQTTEKRADREKTVVVYGAHSLRHYFVTQATAAGMPDAMIKSITGHGSDGMLEHYQQIGAGLAGELATRITSGSKQITESNQREPLPSWARELVEGMNGKTWKQIKQQLLEGGAK